ncbi:NUDIX hydrolase [Alphaproteobacteria bacterium KMM 3653]|uniref:NUDIX hydrolase n=1 Tax=Harenicola maris TaxID=2841044 RepID=A0AAP2CUH9_9RHOB|nr:NUDIX hydrolase [Harenicola maris]
MPATPPAVNKAALRDAASVIMMRGAPEARQVLMGQRGKAAAFMPGKFVFPGGAVDPGDAEVPMAALPCGTNLGRLTQNSALPPATLLAAAIRELWEETGLRLGTPGTWPFAPPPDWTDFAQTGLLPDAAALSFVFRAVTPPGQPRRFDARFVMAEASAITGDIDDFSRASDELSHLQWIPLERVRDFDLPFITKLVLAEVAAADPNSPPPQGVPFVVNDSMISGVTRLL